MNVRQALTEAFRSLPARPGASRTLDAEVLLAHVLGRDRGWLLGHPEAPLRMGVARRFRTLVARRRRGEPLAYLTGERAFFGRPFRVTRATLIPRPESELLVEAALAALPERVRALVADIGTGSGCLAVSIAAERPRVRVIATDRSPGALRVARTNARRHGVADRVTFRRGDLWEALREPVDLVVANLPYLKTGQGTASLRFEPRVALAAGADGLRAYRRLLKGLGRRGRQPRLVLCEIGPGLVTGFRRIVRTTGYRLRIEPDLARKPRLAILSLPALSRRRRQPAPRSPDHPRRSRFDRPGG